jgi:hypothetical protein
MPPTARFGNMALVDRRNEGGVDEEVRFDEHL